jgi:hypothetical protein
MPVWVWLLASGVLAWLLVGRRVAASGRVPAWRYVLMMLYVGVLGFGKFYCFTWGIVRALAQGRHVRVNFGIRLAKFYIAFCMRYCLTHEDAQRACTRVMEIRTWADILDSYDCDVFLDEVQMMLNSREWSMVPAAIVEWSATHRHRLCTVTMAAHRFGTIESTIREGYITRIFLTRKAPMLRRLVRRAITVIPYSLLQFFAIKEDEDDTLAVGKKRGGLFCGFTSNDVEPLDLVIAACYDSTGGVFPLPLALICAEKGKDYGLVLPECFGNGLSSFAVDGFSALSDAELVEYIAYAMLPYVILKVWFVDLSSA